MRTDLAAEVVVGTKIPVSVPSMLLDGLYHIVDKLRSTRSLIRKAYTVAEFHIITTTDHEESGNHEGLGLRTFSLVLSRLERFVRIP